MRKVFWIDADRMDIVFGKIGFRILKLVGHIDAHWFCVENEGVKRFYKFHF